MSDKPFKTTICLFSGNKFEIRVFKMDDGYHVMTYQDDQPAFKHGYFCDYETDSRYKKIFGKHGWQRLIHCSKADIAGVKIYRKFGFENSAN